MSTQSKSSSNHSLKREFTELLEDDSQIEDSQTDHEDIDSQILISPTRKKRKLSDNTPKTPYKEKKVPMCAYYTYD